MRTLIVLCAGSHMVDGIPLYLQRHPHGKLIAEKVIEGIFPENYDRIIYSILKDADDKYHSRDIILNEMGGRYPIEVVSLPQKTEGPAETIYRTIKTGNIAGEIVLKDSHSFIRIDHDFKGNFIAGLDLTTYEKAIEGLQTKSFIVLNEQCQVLDVVEKHLCSDVISSGLYGFKESSDFLLAYEHLNDPNYSIRKLYVSHIISYLIGYKQHIFHSINTTYFEDWATLNAWNKVQKRYSTCFLDLDGICGGEMVFESQVISTLQKASSNGGLFIAYTKRTDVDTAALSGYFRENKISIQAIITGCTFSRSRLLIEDKQKLEELILEG